MKQNHRVLSVFLCTMIVAGASWAAEFKTEQEKRSYAIGANVGKNLKQQQGLDLNPDLIAKGVVEAMSGHSRMSDAEVATIIKQLWDEAKKQQEADRKKVAQENLQRGEAYQLEYAKKEGVRTLPGGTLYRVLHPGAGAKPTGDDSVLCHYRGTHVDGSEFDASPPGKAAAFRLDRIIPAWRDALLEMPVGAKWELVIPASKAYGERGAAPAIGPNETLIFEIELIGID